MTAALIAAITTSTDIAPTIFSAPPGKSSFLIPITATVTAQMAASPPRTWKAFIPAERYRSAARARACAAATVAPAPRGLRAAAAEACAGAASARRLRPRRPGSSAAGSGSAWTAHQTSQSSATIGIFSTTTIQMKPQVMSGDGTRGWR